MSRNANIPAWRDRISTNSSGLLAEYAVASLHQLAAVDRAVYAAIASTPTPALDDPMRRLSTAANYSRIWLGIAAVLATAGGQPGRRAAIRGVLAIGATSALVNLGVKSLWDRERPDRSSTRVPIGQACPHASIDLVPFRALRVGIRVRHGSW